MVRWNLHEQAVKFGNSVACCACHSITRAQLSHSSLNACLIIARVCLSFSNICTKLDPHSAFLCWIHRKIASGQIQDSKQKNVKNQHVQLNAWNFVYWLRRYASTRIYHCIALLQLLHTWQHQSQKLWIRVVYAGMWCHNIFSKL
jgi:hypothetical protein